MWSKERAWEWYNSRPWIRGCNYMSADCANRIDQWQSYGFEERLKTTEGELQLMAKIGFNSIRIFLSFTVWDQEHDTFYGRFDRYLDLCAKYGISCMVCLASDCTRPKEYFHEELGPQDYDWGYHGGRKISQHGTQTQMGYHVLDDPDIAPRFFEMIRETVERHKADQRIIIWNVYNEVGANLREEVTLPNLKRIFQIIRSIDPIQPLTCETWSLGRRELQDLPEVQRYALDNSDIISYHSYKDFVTNVKLIKTLKQYGRPIMNTEWLARGYQNNVQQMFPLFYLENIGCYNWGFVAGKYQTYEPWNKLWDQYYQSPDTMNFDFTKWFHDLFRPNHMPYDPKEIELIRYICDLADRDHEKKKQQ